MSENERTAPGFVQRLRLVAPLVVGAGLLGLFVYLLVRIGGGEEPEEAAPSVQKDPGWFVIEGPPPAPPKPPGPPPEKGLRRWVIDSLPEGWDPRLAAEIARFFEDMAISDYSDSALLAALQDKREEFAKFLASLGPEAIPTLAAILGEEPDFVNRKFLIDALGDLGPKSEEAAYPLHQFYLNSRDEQGAYSELGHVIEAMGKLKNEVAYRAMTREIDDPTTPAPFRDKFIQSLGEHPQREAAIPQITTILHDDGDPNCRNHAAQYLGKTRKPESIDELIAAFGREPSWIVKQTILGSIGKIGSERALPFLMEVALRGDHDGVRLSAANAIRLIGTPKAVKNLQELLQVERGQGIRNRIEGWLQVSGAGR